MKQIIEYIQSYSKALLKKMGVQVAEHPRHKTVQRGVEDLFGPNVGGKHEAPRISPCTYGLMRSVNRDGTILEEGHGTAVNDSPTGMRLLLGVAPSKGSFWKFKPAVRRSGVRSVS